MENKFNKITAVVLLALLVFAVGTNADDNEIYVNQVGATANIDLEQLGLK